MSNGVRRSGSRLPDDPSYWSELAARSVTHALDARRAAGRVPPLRTWWADLATSSLPLAATAVLALLGGMFFIEDRDGSRAEPDDAPSLTLSLIPEDPLLRALLAQPSEPPGEVFLLLATTRETLP
ncbi:MAG: hypothetical protein R3E10_16060 [Gemmatimonadota bacterium]